MRDHHLPTPSVLVLQHEGLLQAQQGLGSGHDDPPLLTEQHAMPGSARSRPGPAKSLLHQRRIEGSKFGQHSVSVCAVLDGCGQPDDHEHGDTRNGSSGKPTHRHLPGFGRMRQCATGALPPQGIS
jgi:hypothetical protein